MPPCLVTITSYLPSTIQQQLCRSIPSYLFLNALDLIPQPLNHPVDFRNFYLGVTQVVTVPPGRDLEFLVLVCRKEESTR